MAIFDLFSKRQARLRGEIPDVYSYDSFPRPLRVQIVHILQEALGDYLEYEKYGNRVSDTYDFLVSTLRHEYGVFSLSGRDNENSFAELANFILLEGNPERVIDAVEISFDTIDKMTRDYAYAHRYNGSEIADVSIEELNGRFREHGIGYHFAEGRILRIDSEFVHAEVVKPALAILQKRELAGAQAEFLKAHEHYRRGDYKESLAECLKSFESIMKVICNKHNWRYDTSATSKSLIQVCLDNGLIPSYWQQHFSALRSVLESGIPPVRNRLGGHGQGPDVIVVPAHIVAYALHMTAATIVFLAEAEMTLK